MKKLILIGIGLAAAAAFIGFDAVEAFVDKTRTSVRSTLMSPEMELNGQLAEAKALAIRCSESIEKGGLSLEQSIALYEEGMQLAKQCQAILDGAEQRITKLRESFNETPADEPADPGALDIRLSFCQIAIQALGGEIYAETRDGGGTSFHLVLSRHP